MATDLPIVCSLEVGPLEQRLAEIGALGEEGLVDRTVEEDRQVLRFRSDPDLRRRLQDVIAAEKECCAFLDLSLRQDGEHLVLSIAAPEEGRPSAEALAEAFAARS